MTLEDILDDKDLIIYKALSEGHREVLNKEYSFSEILFIEDRIKSKIIKNKEYVCELWNEYKNNKSKNKEKFLDNNLYVNQNVYNNQVSLFG